MNVILDTNALILPFTTSIELELELKKLGIVEIYVPECVVHELIKLSNTNIHARSALELAKRFKKCSSAKEGDEGVIEAAQNLSAAVLTNDRNLREKLKSLHVIRIVPRNRAYLEIER